MRRQTYLESLSSSSCSVLTSLLSVLSGRPLAASELAKDTLGRLRGRGVPGPLTFLTKKKQQNKTNKKTDKRCLFFCCLIRSILNLHWLVFFLKSLPFCKRSVPREHDPIHPVNSATAVLPAQKSSPSTNFLKNCSTFKKNIVSL